MIVIGLGSNLPSALGDSRETILAALQRLDNGPVRITARSRLWRSPPMPVSDQLWFVNAVAHVETALDPQDLLTLLHEIENQFGRVRRDMNAARSLDMDIIDYYGRISQPGTSPVLPHPRLIERAFVLHPLADIASDWRHPTSGKSIADLVAALPASQIAEAMNE